MSIGTLLEPEIQTESKQETKQETVRKFWRENPLRLAHNLFGSTLWTKQEDIVLSVRDHPRTAVKSANTIGKTHDASLIALLHLLSYSPSKVITTAPTFTQVEEVLWKEIATIYHNAKVDIGADLLKTELKFNDDWFALGLSTNEVNRFQGFHSPYLLVIIDEALGVSPEIWQAIEGLHPYRILAIGNPLAPEGDFYKCFSSPLWNKISITAQECVDWQNKHGRIPGLVTQQWIDERKEDWGVKSPLYVARVEGEFPQEGTDTLIPMKYVDQARLKESEDDEDDSLKIVSSDVATKHGDNYTVIGYRYGHTLNDIEAYQNYPIPSTAGVIQKRYEKKSADTIVVDSDGIGEGVSDILVGKRIGVLEFHGGYASKAMDSTRYKNLRSQFYHIVSKKFEKGLYSLKGLSQKQFDKLKAQLCSIKQKPPDGQGRIQVETKEDMRARGVISPDYADMMMMSEYAFFIGKFSEIKAYRYRG